MTDLIPRREALDEAIEAARSNAVLLEVAFEHFLETQAWREAGLSPVPGFWLVNLSSDALAAVAHAVRLVRASTSLANERALSILLVEPAPPP